MSNRIAIQIKSIVAVMIILAASATAQTADDKACCTVAEKTNCCAPTSESGVCQSVCSAVCDPGACKVSALWNDPAENVEHLHLNDIVNESGADILNGSVETIRAKYKVPALAGAVASVDGQVAIGFSGVRSAGAEDRISENDKFHLGSCTKAVTATLAGILVDEGIISFQTTIGEVFPELSQSIHKDFQSVTLLELLSHRGGVLQLVRDNNSQLWSTLASITGTPTQQREKLVKIVLHNKPEAIRGSKFLYSDLSYTIAGAMLEKVTGEAFESLVKTKLASPLGITTLGFGAPGTIESFDQPRGHLLRTEKLKSLEPGPNGDLAAPIISPAGTVHMSISDWSKFAALQLTGTTSNGTQLLSRVTLSTLHDDIYEQNYALGWGVSKVAWSSENVYSHTGSCGAWSAAVWVVPQYELVFVAASNYGGAEGFSACSDLLNLMIERYVGSTEVATN